MVKEPTRFRRNGLPSLLFGLRWILLGFADLMVVLAAGATL
jgi:hypothetical protein